VRRRALRAWTFSAAAAFCVAGASGESAAPEYQVKAAFIYKFATYVRWPAAAVAGASAPFVIGVIGEDPFGPALDAVVRGQSVWGKTIIVRRLDRPEDARRWHLVFVCSSERRNLQHILAVLRDTPVLTVSDMDQFAVLGGMIGLVTTEDHHIRFEINKSAIDRAGLKASSTLLQLARVVHGSRSEGAPR
jgi:hypothetical protein